MITESQATVGTKVWFYDNKAKVINTEISSLVFKDNSQNLVVRCLGEKEAIKLDCLTLGHKTNEQVNAVVQQMADDKALIDRVNSAPVNTELSLGLPVIEFKGKIAGDTEETVITPALIAEKSKPLLELKITGLLDTKGAEEVKKAITKAVKMRTAVEPMVKDLKGKLKSQYEAALTKVDEVANPIFEACRSTQNALQKTYDDWQAKVTAAREKEEAELKAKTEGREKKMFELGLTWNGTNFIGYGKSFPKEGLFVMNDEHYAEFITELEGLQMEHGVTGKEVPQSVQGLDPSIRQTILGESPLQPLGGDAFVPPAKPVLANEIFSLQLANGQWIVMTKGSVEHEIDRSYEVLNKQMPNSVVHLHVTK